MARDAELVIGLAREHVHEVVALDPGLAPRTFTLKGLARHVAGLPARPAAQALADYVASDRVAADRVVDADPDDDVEDPYGRPVSAVAETADEIAALLDRIVPRLWPPPVMADP
jgi:protein-tyrosine-phosphatase